MQGQGQEERGHGQGGVVAGGLVEGDDRVADAEEHLPQGDEDGKDAVQGPQQGEDTDQEAGVGLVLFGLDDLPL